MSNGPQTNGNGQMVQYRDKVNTFRDLLEKMKPQMALALPKHVKADRLARIVLTCVQKTPGLLECTRESLLGCVIQAAQLGLEPDGTLGHAYLIPYKTTCTLIPGYKGLLKLARQSGEISSITAHVVHAADEFRYSFGLDETLVHIPAVPPADADENWDPGVMAYVYAVARLKDGTKQFDVMDRWEVNRIRSRSRASNAGPWVTDYEEMAKKTVLRRLCKMLPASVELQTAVALDERADAGIAQELENVIDVQAVASEGENATETATAEPVSKLDKLAADSKAKRKKEITIETPSAAADQMPTWADVGGESDS